MIISELKRYLKSKINMLGILLCCIPVAVSYYFTYVDYMATKEDVINKVPDVNLENAKRMVEGTNGFTYLFNFLSSSDFFIIFSIILLLIFGMTLCGVEYIYRSNGMGNMIFTRVTGVKGTVSILCAQMLYIAIFISSFFAVLTVITLIVLPPNNNEYKLPFDIDNPTILNCLGMILIQMIEMIIVMSLIVFISYMLSIWVNNKYIMMIVPIFFEFIPLMASSVLYNFSKTLSRLVSNFVVEYYFTSIYSHYSIQKYNGVYEISILAFYSILLLVSGMCYFYRVKKEYL